MSGIMQLLLSGRPQAVPDPYFEYTTLLLPGNGTNGAQNNTFLDSSTNAFSITRNGNTTQGTFSPFSQTGWSNYFDGSGDYLASPANSALALGTGDFTLECWVYATSTPSDVGIYEGRSNGNAGTVDGFTLTAFSGSVIRIYSNATLIASSGTSYVNAWCHVAVVRASGTWTLYINGVSQGTSTTSRDLTNNDALIGAGRYGATGAATAYFPGYISNFRIVKGTAVYTSNFTPSTTPLTAITNTSLLTCQSNRFIDNSANNFAITRNGDVSVQAFSPFNPTASWSAATNGGSGYFDGSGDYLDTSTSSSAFAIGTGQFTVEAWVYTTDTVWALVSSTTTGGLVFGYNIDSGTQGLSIYRAGVATAVASNVQIPYGAWTHIAVTRDGSSNVRFYSNGVQIGSTTNNTTDFGTGNQVFRVGADGVSPGSYIFTGYAASVRVIKGAAQYTGTTYTVPTAPLEAIANTSLLLNFTNAGIYDATSKNDLETVGNAQISTTQSKFGGSSMYFDGTGDVVRAPSSNLYDFGSGDWTMEFWMYTGNVSTRQDILDRRASATITGWMLSMSIVTAARLTFYASGPGWPLMTSNTNIASNTWTHVAIVRYGSSFKMYQNGIEVASATSSSAMSDNNYYFQVGNSIDNIYYTGYINDLRVTKGYARYTTNFTAPTAAFPLL